VSRVFRTERPVRLSDTDAAGRLRVDAVARYLQDVASDDWADAGSRHERDGVGRAQDGDRGRRAVRGGRTRRAGDMVQRLGAAAASRRYSLTGDAGGRIEAESVWIHLDRGLRPLRLDPRFVELYGPSAEGRGVVTKLALPAPPAGAAAAPWPLRATDVDRLGHVNNAVSWIPIEERWGERMRRAMVEYRRPIDLSDDVQIVADPTASGSPSTARCAQPRASSEPCRRTGPQPGYGGARRPRCASSRAARRPGPRRRSAARRRPSVAVTPAASVLIAHHSHAVPFGSANHTSTATSSANAQAAYSCGAIGSRNGADRCTSPSA
jgi:Acyl-ACP thioesterase